MGSKVRTFFEGGSRFYADDVSRVNAPGVTSVIGMFPKPYLPPWYAKMTAELAVDSVPFLSAMEREGAINYLKDAAKRSMDQSSGKGSEAHDAFEKMIRGLPLGKTSDRIAPHIKHFDTFLTTVQPELISAEDTLWNDTHGYAGSGDAFLRIRLDETGKRIDLSGEPTDQVVDWKTGKSLHDDVAMQLSAYARGERLVDPDGVSHPVPDVNGAAALHVTEKGWEFRPINISDAVFDAFLGALDFFHVVRAWSVGRESTNKGVIGRPYASSKPNFVTGTERRGK